MKHLMVDIETMGKSSEAAIVAIGAVEFNIESGYTGREFYYRINLQSSLDHGLKMDASTVLWWLKQDDKARTEILKGGMMLPPVLDLFKKFIEDGKVDYQIWGNSPRFDCGILQTAFNLHNMDIPWNFRNERCLRTLVSFAPHIKNTIKQSGITHTALNDCKFQIKHASIAWNYIINITK